MNNANSTTNTNTTPTDTAKHAVQPTQTDKKVAPQDDAKLPKVDASKTSMPQGTPPGSGKSAPATDDAAGKSLR